MACKACGLVHEPWVRCEIAKAIDAAEKASAKSVESINAAVAVAAQLNQVIEADDQPSGPVEISEADFTQFTVLGKMESVHGKPFLINPDKPIYKQNVKTFRKVGRPVIIQDKKAHRRAYMKKWRALQKAK